MQYQTKRKKATKLILEMFRQLKEAGRTGNLKVISAEISIQTGMKVEEVEEIIRTFETAQRIGIDDDIITIFL